MTELEQLKLRVERAKREGKNTIEWMEKRRNAANCFTNESVTLNILEGYIRGILNDLEGNDD